MAKCEKCGKNLGPMEDGPMCFECEASADASASVEAEKMAILDAWENTYQEDSTRGRVSDVEWKTKLPKSKIRLVLESAGKIESAAQKAAADRSWEEETRQNRTVAMDNLQRILAGENFAGVPRTVLDMVPRDSWNINEAWGSLSGEIRKSPETRWFGLEEWRGQEVIKITIEKNGNANWRRFFDKQHQTGSKAGFSGGSGYGMNTNE